jgi:hypothetical protein
MAIPFPGTQSGRTFGDSYQVTIEIAAATWLSLHSDLRGDGGIELSVQSDGHRLALEAERRSDPEGANLRSHRPA